jgi:iron complex transport system substrate-binding protein
MRIVSLLPSLTELVAALGRADDLVGVTHECDHPPGVERLPHVTRSRIPASASSAAIDAMVAEQGGALYELDAELLGSLRPDLILTQAQCDVCAVNERTVREVAAGLPGSPRVESVNPTDLPSVGAMFRRVGELVGASDEADRLLAAFSETGRHILHTRDPREPARVVHLEWLDPPFLSGHWNPGLIRLAGGREVLGREGVASRRATWEEVAAARPEVVLLAPCGFSIERTFEELPVLDENAHWRELPAVCSGRVMVADGSAYFSRPGPRLLDSLCLAAAAIDPARFESLTPPVGWCWLRDRG